jgi:hypothetical protein
MLIPIMAAATVLLLGTVLWYAFEPAVPENPPDDKTVAFLYEGYGPNKGKVTKPNKPR